MSIHSQRASLPVVYWTDEPKMYGLNLSQEDNCPIKKIAVIYPVKGDRWMNNYYRGGQCAINAQQ